MTKYNFVISFYTVISESTLNIGERIISDYHSNLKPNTIEALVYAQDCLYPRFCEEEEDKDDEKLEESGISSKFYFICYS